MCSANPNKLGRDDGNHCGGGCSHKKQKGLLVKSIRIKVEINVRFSKDLVFNYHLNLKIYNEKRHID